MVFLYEKGQFNANFFFFALIPSSTASKNIAGLTVANHFLFVRPKSGSVRNEKANPGRGTHERTKGNSLSRFASISARETWTYV